MSRKNVTVCMIYTSIHCYTSTNVYLYKHVYKNNIELERKEDNTIRALYTCIYTIMHFYTNINI